MGGSGGGGIAHGTPAGNPAVSNASALAGTFLILLDRHCSLLKERISQKERPDARSFSSGSWLPLAVESLCSLCEFHSEEDEPTLCCFDTFTVIIFCFFVYFSWRPNSCEKKTGVDCPSVVVVAASTKQNDENMHAVCVQWKKYTRNVYTDIKLDVHNGLVHYRTKERNPLVRLTSSPVHSTSLPLSKTTNY